MTLSLTPIARACTLALGLTLLHGCDGNGEFSETANVSQSNDGAEFVGILVQQGSSLDGDGDTSVVAPAGGGSGTGGDDDSGDSGDDSDDGDDDSGDDGDGSNGGDDDSGDNGDGSNGDDDDSGDNSDGSNGDADSGDDGDGSNGDDADSGDNGDGSNGDDNTGDGDTIGDGSDSCTNGSCTLGVPNRDLAISALEYSAFHANLALFAEALATNGAATGNYQCIDGGTASFAADNRSNSSGTPTWAFSDCQLPSDSNTSLIYNGHLSSICERSNRTSNDATLECTAVFSNLRVTDGIQEAAINGTVSLTIEGESSRADSAGLSTTTAEDTWTSPSQTIASQSGELRGLNIRVDTLADNLALTVLGQGDFRQSAAGCLLSGELLVGDNGSDAGITITAQSGGNMLLNADTSTETIACSEVNALPYTPPQFQ